ncbi:MAG: flagellar basal body P-ring protein FlgI [Polyangiaceae bacterium]
MKNGLTRFLLSSLVALVTLLSSGLAKADRLRDLVDVVGARDNQLVGYGVVTGLTGTGDDITAPFAAQSLRALLRRLGVQIDNRQLRLRNVAAVVVTATIPPFARNGSRLDVTVSSVGNARSLRGGILVQTPLRGADRKTYAVAQGALVVGGYSASGATGSSLTENTTNTARIPSGALIEREIETSFATDGKLTLALRTPDFGTASRVMEAVNKSLGDGTAQAVDGGAIVVKIPDKHKQAPVLLIAELGNLEVETTTNARVVINERTGTVVAGGEVKLSPVAIAQGGITISVQEQPAVVQPNAFGGGNTTRIDQTQVNAQERVPPAMSYIAGATSLAEVAQALSTFGVSPREMASILQALRAAGALRAEIIVQ